jgi:hypothetical protein
MQDHKKAREFWIMEPSDDDPYEASGYVHNGAPLKSDFCYWDKLGSKIIHVIEYSAYASLHESLKLAIEALSEITIECAGFDEPPTNYWKDELLTRAWKRAKMALATIKAKLGVKE